MINLKIINKKDTDTAKNFNKLFKGDKSMISKINYIKRGTKYIIGAGAMIVSLSSVVFGALEKDDEGYYLIQNSVDLGEFRDKVNGGEVKAKGKLINDIMFNEGSVYEDGKLKEENNLEKWTSIGTLFEKFEGEFIGDNGQKEIVGLYINNPKKIDQGLFGYIGTEGKVSNIKVNESYIIGDTNVGGIVGQNKGTLSNVQVENSYIKGEGISVGGIVGNNEGTIEDCTTTNNIIVGVKYVGGNVGSNLMGTINKISNSDGVVMGELNCIKRKKFGMSIGGNVGLNYKGTIKGNCENSGVVIGKYRVGGNVGSNDGTIESCCKNIGDVEGTDQVGGNIGGAETELRTTLINDGGVTGEKYVGKNVGWLKDGMKIHLKGKEIDVGGKGTVNGKKTWFVLGESK